MTDNLFNESDLGLPEKEIFDKDGFETLVDAIGELPENYRIPFEMKYLFEKNDAEIAAELDLKVKNVQQRIFRAKVKLREMLGVNVSGQ
jgi:RNA polymerase sigma-70 factor (ECF subfamily)